MPDPRVAHPAAAIYGPNTAGTWTTQDVAEIYVSLLINDAFEHDPEEQAPVRLVEQWARLAARYSIQALNEREATVRAEAHAYLRREGFAVIEQAFGVGRG